MTNTLNIGSSGESIARSYLKSCGYKILECNWRHGNHLEIDIIAIAPDASLVAVEVRSHSRHKLYEPFESITESKISRIKRALQIYKTKHNLPEGAHCQVDVVSVITETREVTHFESVDVKF